MTGLTRNPLHCGGKYCHRYAVKVVAKPGACTTPTVSGLSVGFYDNGAKLGQFKTGSGGSVTISIRLKKGTNKLTAVYYGSASLAKSLTGRPLVQSAKLL